jgi:carbon monoxide dehydrogenase subunit G
MIGVVLDTNLVVSALLQFSRLRAGSCFCRSTELFECATAGTFNVPYDGDAQLGGKMASVGQRLIDATAKLMLKQDFRTFRAATATERYLSNS